MAGVDGFDLDDLVALGDARIEHDAEPEFDTAPGVAPWKLEGDQAVYPVGNRVYEVKVEPRCRTCTSPWRGQIEQAMLSGHSAHAISRSLPADGWISHDSISLHVSSGHFPLWEMQKWMIVDQRAQELGVDLLAEGTLALVADEVTLSRMVVQRTQQMLIDGEQDPSIRDGIEAGKLLRDIEQKVGSESLDRDAFKDIMMAHMAAVVRHCTPEQVQAIRDDVYQHPVMVEAFGQLAGPHGSLGA